MRRALLLLLLAGCAGLPESVTQENAERVLALCLGRASGAECAYEPWPGGFRATERGGSWSQLELKAVRAAAVVRTPSGGWDAEFRGGFTGGVGLLSHGMVLPEVRVPCPDEDTARHLVQAALLLKEAGR